MVSFRNLAIGGNACGPKHYIMQTKTKFDLFVQMHVLDLFDLHWSRSRILTLHRSDEDLLSTLST